MQQPAVYPHPVDAVQLLETHISWVLLTGDYAYKIKKPVNLGFLDFSTLAKRRYFCAEEIRLNSRLAAGLYLQVVRITGTVEKPEIDGAGPVLDYAVKMRQFAQQDLLVQSLTDPPKAALYLDQLADLIAEFHNTIKVADGSMRFGSAQAVLEPVQENFRQLREVTGNTYQSELDALETWSLQEHQRCRAVFVQRKRDGFIRECHGDLHLGNIARYKDRVVPFDGIEFNPSLYWIDVISELAFLVMDLQAKRQAGLSFRVLNAYLQCTGDYAGLQVLRYYLVYRALVRAKVAGIQLKQQANAQACAEQQCSLDDYLHLATRYTRMAQPSLLLCHGLSAAGKSTVSQHLLEQLPGIRIRSDIERKRLFADAAAIPVAKAQGLYSAPASEKTYQRLLQLATLIIDAGYTVIVDAAFLQYAQRRQFVRYARQQHVPFLIVHCQARQETLCRRIVSRAEQVDNVSDADLVVLEQQIKHQQTLSDQELAYCISIDTEAEIDLKPVLQRINPA